MVRKAQFAGAWYPGDEEGLRSAFEGYGVEASPKKAVGLIAPHAGYVYSGRTAFRTYAAVEVPPTVVVLGIQHRAFMRTNALYPGGSWQTPLGDVQIDEELSQMLLDGVDELERDAAGHEGEHSLELQMPFLKYFRDDVKVCPISVAERTREGLVGMGRKIAAALMPLKASVLVAASSDMTHFETEEHAKSRDMKAIERVLALDAEGLYDTVESLDITMCGAAPATVMLAAARELGAKEAELIEYTSSAAVSGDTSNVVGYAGVVVR